MATAANGAACRPSAVGTLVRRWRESRRLSQLALGLDADVSPRHISFIETGRARPSPSVLLALATALDVSLREQNALLQAAGYPPVFPATPLDAPPMAPLRTAIELLLRQHEPRSAIAFDRRWDLVMVNSAYSELLALTFDEPPADLVPFRLTREPRPNFLRLVFDPRGVRRTIVNWESVARALLNDVHRARARSHDPELQRLLDELMSYPGVPKQWREPELAPPPGATLAFEMNLGGTLARFFSAVTTLGKPQDVTLDELYIETFFPADAPA